MTEPLTDDQRLQNLKNAAQDIRTCLETPKSFEVESRIWRAVYVLDGIARAVRLIDHQGQASILVFARHDMLGATTGIGDRDNTPEELAIYLGLDNLPDGRVKWTTEQKNLLAPDGKPMPIAIRDHPIVAAGSRGGR